MQFNPGGGPMMHPIGAPQPVNPVLALLQRLGLGQVQGLHSFVHPGTPGQYGEATPHDNGLMERLASFGGGGSNPLPLLREAAPTPQPNLHERLSPFLMSGQHSDFLEGIPPEAHGAVLKLIARLTRMPVGVGPNGHTRPGFHSQSTHAATVAQRNAAHIAPHPMTFAAE